MDFHYFLFFVALNNIFLLVPVLSSILHKLLLMLLCFPLASNMLCECQILQAFLHHLCSRNFNCLFLILSTSFLFFPFSLKLPDYSNVLFCGTILLLPQVCEEIVQCLLLYRMIGIIAQLI